MTSKGWLIRIEKIPAVKAAIKGELIFNWSFSRSSFKSLYMLYWTNEYIPSLKSVIPSPFEIFYEGFFKILAISILILFEFITSLLVFNKVRGA